MAKEKMEVMRLFAFVLCILEVTASHKKSYSGDQVLTVYPQNEIDVAQIKALEDFHGNIDFWKPKYAEMARVSDAVDIHISKDYLSGIKDLFEENGIEYRVKIEDLQEMIDNQLKGRGGQPQETLVHNYNVYHTLEEIYQWVEDMAAEYPTFVQVDVLGQSTEGRNIPMMTISTDPNNPAVFIDCTFHAREWISPAVCQCFTRNLLEGYGKDPHFTKLLDSLTYYIIPVINVDGYVYSWETERMWRKTRSNYGTLCDGVDPNRNTDANWGGRGASNNSCSETYHGPFVESEPEIKVYADFVRANADHIMAYISMHSYSQLFVLPWSYTYVAPDNIQELEKYAEQAATAIENVFGTHYDYGQGSKSLYLVSGGSKDFAYNQGIPWTCTLELRDTGDYGFVLPEDQIEPSCVETMAGIRSLSDSALELWYNKAN